MPKHFKKPDSGANKNGNRKTFIDYLDKYCDFLFVMETANGTYFLTFEGCDWGNLTEKKIKDADIKFDRPGDIDAFIQNVAKSYGYKIPEVTYKEYLATI